MSDCVALDELVAWPDRMPAVLTRYRADREALERRFTAPWSARRRERLRGFLEAWQEALEGLPFDEFARSDRVDWLLLRALLSHDLRHLEREERQFAEMEPLIPFAADLIALEDERRELADAEPGAMAERLYRAREALVKRRKELEDATRDGGSGVGSGDPTYDGGGDVGAGAPTYEGGAAVAWRAAEALEQIGKTLGEWYAFHSGYDPEFTWWAEKPYKALEEALKGYGEFVRKKLAGAEDEEAIVGDSVGREALIEELEYALIPYTPEELVEVGKREMEWCTEQMVLAAREMGLGDDWRAALEQVKADHVPPGKQPALVRDLAWEAIEYLQERGLVTVPPLARECWRMEMMSPEKQKVNPFFLGGETIVVSFPTNTMDHADKRMSLRGNNRAFSRTTVQHELIPGHYLQAFSQERHRPYRRVFYTPFWVEGWALHWELLLWDLGFPGTPEERMGMLFWRKHRCARVVFSLRFHLGEMTPQECVDMLVNEVGHEPANARGEVRRSCQAGYGPLYQCAYLIGGLQFRSLHSELVGSGRLTNREFHDAILRENTMPIAALRALLLGRPVEKDFDGDWRFLDGAGGAA
jgi:hypothetical protein